MLDFTPWFDSDTPPVREGVYQVATLHSVEADKTRTPWFSFWTGIEWMWLDTTPEEAFRRKETPTGAVIAEWRGLTQDIVYCP